MNTPEHEALRVALQECKRAVMTNYPYWLQCVERLAVIRSGITGSSTKLTRTVDNYLKKARP